MMTTADPMTARGAHYTALLETIDTQGAAKLHAREREQLLEAADALLFGEPENRRLLRSAEEVIGSLEGRERWSAESCDQLREHLYGCDTAGGAARERAPPAPTPSRPLPPCAAHHRAD